MVSSRRSRRKPLAVFEHGTRLYAPSAAEAKYRVVTSDVTGRRMFFKFTREADARGKARELEAYLGTATPVRGSHDDPRSVAALAARYVTHLEGKSLRYAERQQAILRNWILPTLGGTPVSDWTSADSEAVLNHARLKLAPGSVQNVGATMRGLVTFAHKSRWLPRELDPMWLVSYSCKAEFQGQAIGFTPRDSLPTDEECFALFDAMAALGHEHWALAMRLKHRSGARFGELIALRPSDIDFEPNRVVRIHRSVEQSSRRIAIKTTKNEHKRSSIFPASLSPALASHVADVRSAHGEDALLFPAHHGGPMERRQFLRIWFRAAQAAGWPLKSPTVARWHPHQLRHAAACWMLFDVKIDPAVVSLMLGHANPAFTLSRYVGVRGNPEAQVTALTDAW
jgi:integrase